MNMNITLQDKTRLITKLSHYNTESNRISRDVLAQELGYSLRKLRAVVHEINADDSDHLVLTDTDQGGYWLAHNGDSAPAVRNYYAEESRAMELLKKTSAMKRKIRHIYGDVFDANARMQEKLL